MKVLLIGPQGSGKSTQAEMLASFSGSPKVSTGDIFRELAGKDTKEGRKIREIIENGRLIDDQTTANIVKAKLQSNDFRKGFILDGYPRNLTQKGIYDPDVDKVFYLNVPEEEVIRRLMKRGRKDDTEEAIRTRLNLYLDQTEPMINYYKSKGILTEIDGIGSPEEVQKEIRKNLKV